MLVMGVDENGLGPRLGPLVATGVVVRVPRYRRAELCARGLAEGLTDSKDAGGFGRMAFVESVALAMIERTTGRAPHTSDALLDALSPKSRGVLRSLCPSDQSASQCWQVDLELPIFGGDLRLGRERIEALIGRSSLELVRVESRMACVGLLNARQNEGRNKLDVDLELFEDLIASAGSTEPLLAICGMVGGIRNYAPRFRRLQRIETMPGRRGQRRYRARGLREVRFEVHADARHLPVSLASMVGKYLREVSMLRVAEFYRREVPGLRLASGYHDPVTTRFIEQTRGARTRLGVVPSCFQRRA